MPETLNAKQPERTDPFASGFVGSFGGRHRGILWFAGGFLLVTLIALVGAVYLPGMIAGGSFGARRATLNERLREAILQMGVRTEERAVVETRDRIIDGSSSWFVLNWRVKVKPGFDFSFARQKLEQVIVDVGGQPGSYWNSQDPVIPLKTEAFIDKRLSHRIFFTVEPVAEEPNHSPILSASSKEPAQQRSRELSGRRLALDRSLQQGLARLNLNGPPLFFTEYWENGAERQDRIVNWVISISSNYPVTELLPALEQSVPAGVEIARFKTAQRTGLRLALALSIGQHVSHRLFFTTYPAYRGRNAARWQRTDAIYIAPPRVAIIIDDIGYDRDAAMQFLNMGVPITLSILPHRPFSTELALRAKKLNAEIMLHLPMEPESFPTNDPGAGAIFVGYPADQIGEITTEDIDAVPYISGVNNHMGSRAMADPQTVQAMLEAVRKKNLFFVDSRTAANSVGLRIARNLNLRANERSVFIDITERADIQYRKEQLASVIRKAKENGSCIAIGHPSPETITAIRQMLETFREEGIVFVYASDLVS